MISGIIAFVAGVTLLQLMPSLPDPGWTLLFSLLFLPALGFRQFRWAVFVALGFLWALYLAELRCELGLQPHLAGRDLVVEGTVESLPELRSDRTRFEFRVESLQLAGSNQPTPERIRLSWYHAPAELVPGERWRLLVRLKPPRGFVNPGGFDYEGWLFRAGLGATGYVRKASVNQRLAEGDLTGGVDRIRASIRDKVTGVLHDSPGRGLILALAIGDRSGLDPQQWQLFQRTGTSHLVAISGLHIGIVAGLGLFLFRRFWAVSERLVLCCPAPRAAAIAALSAAVGYAALAGFSVPTQRALIMLLVLLAGCWVDRVAKAVRSLAIALFLVVMVDPFAPLSVGFWLSFGAVTAILLGMSGRLPVPRQGWQWGRVQWVVAIGLMPLLLWNYGQLPLTAPLINLLAVPWFSLVIVPLVLLGVVLIDIPGLGSSLLKLVDWLLSGSLQLLEFASQKAGWMAGIPALPVWVWPPVFIAIGLLLAPRGVPARWLGLLLLLPLVLVRPAKPATGDIWLTLLDVGQGLSVVIRTAGHTLVYDTGARFSASFDTGSRVVAPYLRSIGVEKIERLILSNADNDHAGGAAGLLSRIEVQQLFSGESDALAFAGHVIKPCEAGDDWIWEEVHFQVVHPDADTSWRGNDASCVLLVDNGTSRILVAGDIERRAESKLLDTLGSGLKADLLIVPHHGSESSSTQRFVDVVRPEYALFPTGYLNRYGFPKASVVKRWQQAGARILDTAVTGAISFRLHADGTIEGPVLARSETGHYWTARP